MSIKWGIYQHHCFPWEIPLFLLYVILFLSLQYHCQLLYILFKYVGLGSMYIPYTWGKSLNTHLWKSQLMLEMLLKLFALPFCVGKIRSVSGFPPLFLFHKDAKLLGRNSALPLHAVWHELPWGWTVWLNISCSICNGTQYDDGWFRPLTVIIIVSCYDKLLAYIQNGTRVFAGGLCHIPLDNHVF